MKRILLPFVILLVMIAGTSAQTVIAEKAISVNAGSSAWLDFPFTQPTRLWGKFRASGGKNDIEVYIVDDDGLENLRNGNQFSYYYFSGRVTVGTFDKRLPRGNYHLVFNNSWALMTPKAVTVQFYSDGSNK